MKESLISLEFINRMSNQTKIIFTNRETAIITESFNRAEKIISEKIQGINWLMAGIILVMFVGFVAMIASTIVVVIDSSRFNSTVYKEYSSKIQIQNETIKTNIQLLEKNRQLIKQLQKNNK